jgi:hypothetical protein
MTDRPVLELLLGDVVRLKRAHPCGGVEWQIDRLGADIGLRCRTCGRHVLIERPMLEKRIAAFVSRGDRDLTTAAAPKAAASTAAPTAGAALTAARPASEPGRTR